MNRIYRIFCIGVIGSIVLLASCRKKNSPGVEFAPNMYHSVAYEPLSQITDTHAGWWMRSNDKDTGEFFNSNIHNPHHMNMRLPVKGTIPRRGFSFTSGSDTLSTTYFISKHIHPDSLAIAAKMLKNPLQPTDLNLESGKLLYTSFCSHCHGENGKGDGEVGKIYKGVPSYSAGKTATLPAGHIYHVITHGIRRMWPHGSQISPEDRWKIVLYVQTLQKQQ